MRRHTAVRAMFRTFALATVLASTSCGWIIGEIAEDLHRQSALDDHVYKQDIALVWKELRDIWSSHGCELPEQPKLGETIACEATEKRWLRVDARSGGHQVEIEVERYHKNTEGKKETTRERDWTLEWKLLERVDPERAKEIQAESEAKGAKAKKGVRNIEDSLEDKSNE